MSIEAMKQALEALEEVQGHMNTSDWFNERVDTLRTAIEQAEKQEPSGWVNHANIASAVAERERGGSGDTHTWSESKTAYHTVPFYTTPPAAPVQEPAIDHSCKDTYELIMKWADIYAAQTGELYSQAAQDPSKTARMAGERTMLACVVAQAFPPQPHPAPDLLNALKRIVDEPNNTMSDGKALKEIIRIARAAINKATGEKT
jgi:hypothetical protein